MKQAGLVSLVVLWGTLPLMAQSAIPGSARIAGLQSKAAVVPANSACPVAMQARHLADGAVILARKGDPPSTPPKGVGQWLHLTLASRVLRQITGATVEVHGLADKSRVIQTLSTAGMATDANQTLRLQLTPAGGNEMTAEVWVPGMTAVETIDLTSVSYADGSTWKLADGQSCRIAPDPLMLISGHTVTGR